MALYAVLALAALVGLAMWRLWTIRGRRLARQDEKIARLEGELSDLRTYVASLDEADRLSHVVAAPASTAASVAQIPRARGRGRALSPVPAARLDAACRAWSDPRFIIAAASIAASLILVSIVVWASGDWSAGDTELADPPVVWPTGPPVPPDSTSSTPAPSPSQSARDRDDRRPGPVDRGVAHKDEDEGKPTRKAADVEGGPVEVQSDEPTEEPSPDPSPTPSSPTRRLVDSVVDVQIDLGDSAPEPSTLLGKATG